MALPIKTELQTLDYAFEGLPFAYIEAKDGVETDGLDFAYLGLPFFAADTPAVGGDIAYANTSTSAVAYAFNARTNIAFTSTSSSAQSYSRQARTTLLVSNTGTSSESYSHVARSYLATNGSSSTSVAYTASYGGTLPQGPYAPSNAHDTGEAVVWTNPTSAFTHDSAYAYMVPSSTSTNNSVLELTGFGFSIPTGATILGVQVQFDVLQYGGTTGNVRDSLVKLVKGGNRVGTDYATGTNWTGSASTLTYGGFTDLWGTTLTVADVNASNFGVSIRVRNTTGGDRTAGVDAVRMLVVYQALDAAYLSYAASTVSAEAYSTVARAYSLLNNSNTSAEAYSVYAGSSKAYTSSSSTAVAYAALAAASAQYLSSSSSAISYTPVAAAVTSYSNVVLEYNEYTVAATIPPIGYTVAGTSAESYNTTARTQVAFSDADTSAQAYVLNSTALLHGFQNSGTSTVEYNLEDLGGPSSYSVQGTSAAAYVVHATTTAQYSQGGSGSVSYLVHAGANKAYNNAISSLETYTTRADVRIVYQQGAARADAYSLQVTTQVAYGPSGVGAQTYTIIAYGDQNPDSFNILAEWEEWEVLDGVCHLRKRSKMLSLAAHQSATLSLTEGVSATLVVRDGAAQ